MSKKAQEGSSIFCPEDVPEAGDLNQSEGQNAPDFPDESSENDMSGIVLADLDFVETTCRKMLKQISTMAGSIRNLEHVSKLWRERNGTSYGRGMYSVDALSTAENKAKTQFLSTLESVYRIEIRTPIKIIEAAPFPLPAGGGRLKMTSKSLLRMERFTQKHRCCSTETSTGILRMSWTTTRFLPKMSTRKYRR